MELKVLKKIIISELNSILKPLGFKRNGNVFINATEDLVYYITSQSSTSSSASKLKFTINIDIRSQKLYQLYESALPFDAQDHYRFRIGRFIDPIPTDKWWVIEDERSAILAAEEIKTLIIQKVIPEFASLTSINDIYILWKQGIGTGITAKAEKYYSELLEKANLAKL